MNLMVNTASKHKQNNFSEAMANTASPLPAIPAEQQLKMQFSSNNNSISDYRSSHLPQVATTALEQYRLQLYNYALNIERLRCPQYSVAATAMAAAAAYASSNQSNGLPSFNANDVAHHPHHPAHAQHTYPTTASTRLAALSSISLFPHRIFQPEDPKPQHSYIGLIAMAILSSAELKLVLSDIYQYILDNYPYFRTRGPGWRNSIRHNLSLNDCFIKSGRSANGKGHYWAIHPANMDDFRKGDFRRRKAQRKVRKHMGLSVDDAGTDSPSPPPLDLTSPPPQLPPSSLSTHVAMQHAAFAAFTYPYQHNYIGQFFGRNGIVTNNGQCGALQRLQNCPNLQQSQIPQYHTVIDGQPRTQSDQHAEQQQHVAYINSTTTTTIANLYSQTRKRQFDMASILAPDVHLIEEDESIQNNADRVPNATQTHHTTVITKVSVQQHRELLVGLSDTSGEQDGDLDVDVVVDGSDMGEDEMECNQECKEEAGNEIISISDNNLDLVHKLNHNHQETLAAPRSPTVLMKDAPTAYEASLCSSNNSSHQDANSIEEDCSVATLGKVSPTSLLNQQPAASHIELSQMNPEIFRRYYGSYMAAAAATRMSLGSGTIIAPSTATCLTQRKHYSH